MTSDSNTGLILLLGGNELNQGISDLARSWGCELIVADWNESPFLAGDRHYRVDIKDRAALMARLADNMQNVRLAYTSADAAVESVAHIHELIGYRTPSSSSLHAARNKVAMNRLWSAASLLQKQYRQCFNAVELSEFALSHAGPLVVKPVDASSSRGLTVTSPSRSPVDYEAIFRRAADLSSDGSALAEEYIQGTEFTVEMIGDAYGNVEVWGVSKKYHTENTLNNCISVKLHYAPTEVPRKVQESLAEFGARCFRALGLRSSLGHLEVILTQDGKVVPVELAARSSGFIATHLLDALYGTPHAFLNRYMTVLQGERISNGLRIPSKSSMYFFYDPPRGVWQCDGASLLSASPRAAGIESLKSGRSRLVAGTPTCHIDSDNERIGFEILCGSPENLTIENVLACEHALYADCVKKTEQHDAHARHLL